ncbi:hypothetical protein [Campylobacter gracilis]|uniref:hypothetical protein n=1 Tax=Campylobacter gracilis TaxID=824 RepID=UPI00067B9AF0|nr:hypothetical protein [Campylobacter gracilis]AKT93441.1 putative membrane protein [Campylobacter gracilis]UEB46455.1 hypothetical protein LK410_05050 [Campylobacter gracilis]SUW78230.1 Uncharacterised protein [Campylobacter gracilis]
MGFAKFLSPRRIKLARGTARNFKLELAAADTAKFSFTLERLCFTGILDLKRDGLYLPIREGDELAVIYEASSSNSSREALRGLNSDREALSGENSAERPNCEISSSGNSTTANSNRDAYSDTAASARQNSTASDLSDKDRSGINSAASPLDFVNLSLGAQRWKDAGSTALAAIFAAFGVALAAMSIYCIIFIFDAKAPAGLLALLILAPFAYCSFRFMRRDWRAAKFGRIFAALAHSKEPKRSGEAEGYASGVRVLQSDDVYYYGFALDGLYLSGDSKRRIVSDALRVDQNLAELADGENCMKFKNLNAEDSANSASVKNFAKSANSTSSANSTNAANSINSARSAEVAAPAKAKDAPQSFELQNGDILRARYKDYRISGLWNQSRGMKLGDTRSGLRRVIDFIASVALQIGLRLGGTLVLTRLGDHIGGDFGNALSFIGFLLLLSLML